MSVVTVAGSVGALGQPVSPTPQMTQLGQLVGKWVYQEEFRAKPDAGWEKGSSQWENRWLGEGVFLETPGSMTFPGGRRVSVAQVYGYDPARKVHFTSYFVSDGTLGTGTWDWTGAAATEEDTEVAPNGTKTTLRCTSTLSPDSRSMEGSCERSTDGKWWVFRRFKGTKQ